MEEAAGAMTDASPEAWWSVERLRGGNGLVRGWGLRYITLSYACLGWGVGVAYSIRGGGGYEKLIWCK